MQNQDRYDVKTKVDNRAQEQLTWPPFIMKNSPFNAIFLAAVVVSSLWSVWLCYTVIARNRELRQLQARFAGVNHNQQLLASLANDAVEYSKKNPAIEPLLESIGIKPRGTNATTPATSTNKPAGK
jgi:hypothetical protein